MERVEVQWHPVESREQLEQAVGAECLLLAVFDGESTLVVEGDAGTIADTINGGVYAIYAWAKYPPAPSLPETMVSLEDE